MRHQIPHHAYRRPSLASFFASVRVRLTLWYLMTIMLILLTIGGSLYGLQAHINAGAIDSQVETQLYHDIQPTTNIYRQALLNKQALASQRITLSTNEVMLLLRSDGSILDTRGPLTTNAIQLMQAQTGSGQTIVNLTLPLNRPRTHGWGWWAATSTNNYRILVVPILQQDTRIAILMIGLPRENLFPMANFWLGHGFIILLISLIGGYWLASKAMRPVRMITRMANEINATDLRRRLHLKRKDEFGELAATFDQMLARLEAAFKRQTQFTADASHELRTPLTIIDLEINRALTQAQTPEEYRQVLTHIQTENEQMATIVNDLLLLARADTGQITLHPATVDLSDIALSCVERLLPLARQSEITLSTGELPELLISGDSHYLNRMLMNLVENGIKYTSGSGKRVHVELTCEQERWGIIRVQDDGPGIADEDLPSLFERFYRVDRARTRKQKGQELPGGSGLGLAIAQWIAQAHGGEIRVASKIGAGSTFEIRLPLLKETEDDKAMTKKEAEVHVL
ncbi:MAG TPA: HAMP domain-containing sensor histidine kinase, partial [Ktedonobacteraceae bacterium]|nr:HAMP domain-containing sensor histidine kinase [Ktedonobacteraceae bacterium]